MERDSFTGVFVNRRFVGLLVNSLGMRKYRVLRISKLIRYRLATTTGLDAFAVDLDKLLLLLYLVSLSLEILNSAVDLIVQLLQELDFIIFLTLVGATRFGTIKVIAGVVHAKISILSLIELVTLHALRVLVFNYFGGAEAVWIVEISVVTQWRHTLLARNIINLTFLLILPNVLGA